MVPFGTFPTCESVWWFKGIVHNCMVLATAWTEPSRPRERERPKDGIDAKKGPSAARKSRCNINSKRRVAHPPFIDGGAGSSNRLLCDANLDDPAPPTSI